MSGVMTNMKHYGSPRNRKRPNGNFVTTHPMYLLLDMDVENNTQVARYK